MDEDLLFEAATKAMANLAVIMPRGTHLAAHVEPLSEDDEEAVVRFEMSHTQMIKVG